MKSYSKKILFGALAFLMAAGTIFSAVAQESPEKETIYVVVEDSPRYPGGDEELRKFIATSLKYPEDALKEGREGMVYISFILNKEGVLRDPKVVKGLGGSCDEEALRVVRLLKGWSPARQNGQYVSYQYVLPLRFRLPETQPEKKDKIEPGNIDLNVAPGVVPQEEPEEDIIYTALKITPKYPGGQAAMEKFIKKNLNYPKEAIKEGKEGRVFVSFVIGKNGEQRDAKVVKGIGGPCDEEALRVVKMLKGWTPAQHNGQLVSYNYILPVSYKLPPSKKAKK